MPIRRTNRRPAIDNGLQAGGSRTMAGPALMLDMLGRPSIFFDFTRRNTGVHAPASYFLGVEAGRNGKKERWGTESRKSRDGSGKRRGESKPVDHRACVDIPVTARAVQRLTITMAEAEGDANFVRKRIKKRKNVTERMTGGIRSR